MLLVVSPLCLLPGFLGSVGVNLDLLIITVVINIIVGLNGTFWDCMDQSKEAFSPMTWGN